jgi:epoxyqueuosine reductase
VTAAKNVPPNAPWLAQERPLTSGVAKQDAFDSGVLLHMDGNHYVSRVWPHMFYMGPDDIWRWKMNTARAMGNSRDPEYVPDLIRAWGENTDARVLVMVAWAMGRIGGTEARNALNGFLAVRGQVSESSCWHSRLLDHTG